MNKAQIIEEIKQTAKANGGVPLGWRKFATETGIKEYDWKGKLWARWNDAVREAGLVPNELTEAYEERELLDKFAKLALELGRLPAVTDIRFSVRQGWQFPEYKTFTKRFGGKPQLIAKLAEYCKGRREYADVLGFCEGYVPQRSGTFVESVPSTEAIGFVYLIKSGRFYKVGRSNAVGRREYELAIQLPEKATTAHVIRTDDPCGIEAYWHNRFKTKRKNGEWFELDASDIAAFKRRKLM
jgi:hypothetical protein